MADAGTTSRRRSLKYIRLAAFLAGQPPGVDRVELTIPEIERLVDHSLPGNSRFPSWWRNDERKMHSRAWLTAGWEVSRLSDDHSTVVFVRK
jgi:hypothetical protein